MFKAAVEKSAAHDYEGALTLFRELARQPVGDAALRFPPGDHAALAAEALLGSTRKWAQFLSLAGCELKGKTVAEFNDAGLLLQAAEQDLGIALASEVLAADALQAGRLVRLSPLRLATGELAPYWFVYPPQHAQLPALGALRQWLHDEMAQSRASLAESGR